MCITLGARLASKTLLLLQQYTDTKSLRYGHLMIMTDQDHDGSHIKGLIMNYLHHFYPSLLQIPGFLVEFITPIIKARRWGVCGVGTRVGSGPRLWVPQTRRSASHARSPVRAMLLPLPHTIPFLRP